MIIFGLFSLLGLLTWGWKVYMTNKGYFHGYHDFSGGVFKLYKIYRVICVQLHDISNAEFQKGIAIGVLFVSGLMYKKLQLLEAQFLIFLVFLSWAFTFFSILPWSLININHGALTATPRLIIQSAPLLIILLSLFFKDAVRSLIFGKSGTVKTSDDMPEHQS